MLLIQRSDSVTIMMLLVLKSVMEVASEIPNSTS